MLRDADEVEVLLDKICDLEGHLLLPWFDIVFGRQVIKEVAVGGCKVCRGCHGLDMDDSAYFYLLGIGIAGFDGNYLGL